MKALVIGGTGATGKHLVQDLLQDNSTTEVHIFVRRQVNLSHPKLHVHVVDFEHPEQWADLVQGDTAFSCLGTSLKEAGSKEAQHRIDVDYQLSFARTARRNGVHTFALISAVGADVHSRLFYNRLKGEVEEGLKALQFGRTVILQPSFLDRGAKGRFREDVGMKVFKVLNRIGLLRRLRPITTEMLAARMLKLAKTLPDGLHTVTADAIHRA